MADPKPRRRWLRFSLRSLLLVMLLVCVTLGWKAERARKQRKAVEWVLQSGGWVRYDYEVGSSESSGAPPGPDWLRNTLGIDFFADVVGVGLNDQPVSDVSPLAGLRSLRQLNLPDTQVSDVSPLAGLTSLERLDLSQTQVNDVSPLARLTSLDGLFLDGTPVSDVSPLAGLTSLDGLQLCRTPVSDVSPLAGLTSLRWFDLIGTPVSDVSPLAELPSLKQLFLSETQVSDTAAQQLRLALPNCDISGP